MPHAANTTPTRAPAVLVPRPRAATSGVGRVSIISASVGAGHDGAAAELARRLSAQGYAVDRFDLLDLLPAHLGRTVQEGYHRMLVRAPWAYQRIYSSTERAGGGGQLARALLRTAQDRVLRALPPDTGAIVSTYPGASRVLGRPAPGRSAGRAGPHLPDRLLGASAVGRAGRGRPPRRPRRARRPGAGRRGPGRARMRTGHRSALPALRHRAARAAAGRLRFAAQRPAGPAGRRVLGRRPGPQGGAGTTRLRRRRAGRRLRTQRGPRQAAARGRHRTMPSAGSTTCPP